MLLTSLILGLVGVFCILDSRLLGRLNFERPLISCTIVGLILGDLPTGLAVGASIELMSLGLVVIGAAAPPDMNMAAIICSAFAILTDASTETALALAIPIAVLGQMLGVLMRTILSNLTHAADAAILQGSMVGITTPITFESAGLVLQDIVDSILPCALDLAVVMAMYAMIKKRFKTGWLLAICIVGGIVINALHILV